MKTPTGQCDPRSYVLSFVWRIIRRIDIWSSTSDGLSDRQVPTTKIREKIPMYIIPML